MNADNTTAREKQISLILGELHKSRKKTPSKNCPLYPQDTQCVKAGCLWYDKEKMECWILNPKPLAPKRMLKETTLEHAGKREMVYDMIKSLTKMKMRHLIAEAEKEKIGRAELKYILGELKGRGLVHEPSPGVVEYVKD